MRVVLDDFAYAPCRAHTTDAGIDLRSPIDVEVPPHGSAIINTGVHIELPHKTAGLLVSKSGLNVKHNITSSGLIDENYTGAIAVKLYNHGEDIYRVEKGDRISQLVVIEVRYEPVEIVGSYEDKKRMDNGFGSTGR